MRRYFAVAAAALLFSVTAAFADPVGKYNVKGTNPGTGTSYTGTVSVERTGDTYKIVWVIDGTRYVGTGIGNKDFLAVSYRAGSDTGLALYGPDGDNWIGVWTYAGGNEMGTDRWTRR